LNVPAARELRLGLVWLFENVGVHQESLKMTDTRDGDDPMAAIVLAGALLFGLVFWATFVLLLF
jgi:hypothetical protein